MNGLIRTSQLVPAGNAFPQRVPDWHGRYISILDTLPEAEKARLDSSGRIPRPPCSYKTRNLKRYLSVLPIMMNPAQVRSSGPILILIMYHELTKTIRSNGSSLNLLRTKTVDTNEPR